ncbi:MAG: hypothetical protein OEW67_06190, partial [Cyclobacteriaceae bacterium]|nr:hypothetical protein [Cyclobacteriaceae bacterium]
MSVKNITLLISVMLISVKIIAQTKGLIYQPSTSGAGQIVLDPNSDGYISAASTGFTTAVQGTPGDDEPEFENSSEWLSFPTLGNGEVLSDIRSGPNEGFTDFSITNTGVATYYRFDGVNMIFRFRLADYRPNAKGYTVLIDTDSQFGDGKDTEYSSENPGFEVAVVLQNKVDVFVYDVNTPTPSCTPTLSSSHIGGTHQQKSISGIQEDGDLDYFYDFYVPISELGITASTPIRLAATTNTSNSYTFCGSISDVGGVDDNAYAGCLECLFTDLIDPQVPTAPNGGSGFPENRTDCPIIDGSYPVGTVNITGTAVPGGNMRFYLNGTEVVSASVIADGVTGVYISGDIVTSSIGDIIAVTATDIVSIPNLSESDITCATTTITATPVCTGTAPAISMIVNANGEAEITTPETVNFTLTNATNALLNVYSNGINIVGASLTSPAEGTIISVDNTSTAGFITWTFKMNKNGTKVPCGTLIVTMEDIDNGLCASSTTICNTATGGCSSTVAAIPLITTTTITTGTTSISGTSDASVEIALYVDGIGFATGTSSATGAWTISGLNLSGYLCQSITATANVAKGCTSIASTGVTVTQVSTAPTIISPPYCGTTTVVYGTSFESDGTTPNVGATITLNVGGSAIVSESGDWSITGLSLTGGTSLSATVIDSDNCQTVSASSSTVFILTPTATPTGIVNAVAESDATITGTCTSGSSVNVYIDEILLGAATVSGTTWSYTVVAFDLYVGGSLQFTETIGGACESALSSSTIIPCSPDPPIPTLTYAPVCADLTGATVDVTVGNVTSGIIYTLVDGSDADFGISEYSFGTTDLILTSSALTVDPSIIKVKADEFNPGTTCASISTISVSIDLNPHLSITSSTSTPASCTASDGTITVSGLDLNTAYSMSYVRNGGSPTVSSVTSTGAGTFVITGLSNGNYTDIKFTANACTSPGLSEILAGTGATATSFPVVANPTSVSSGSASSIEIGDGANITNSTFTYSLYNKGTNTFIASAAGDDLGGVSISTGNLTVATTFYVVVDEGGGNCSTLTTEPIITLTTDVTPPSVDIQGEPLTVNNTSTYSVTIEFSEDVTGFVA